MKQKNFKFIAFTVILSLFLGFNTVYAMDSQSDSMNLQNYSIEDKIDTSIRSIQNNAVKEKISDLYDIRYIEVAVEDGKGTDPVDFLTDKQLNEENLLSRFDEDILSFSLLNADDEYNTITTINGTSEINNGTNSSSPAGQMWSESRECYGVITCGHGYKKNNKIYYGNTKIGKIKAREYNGTNDSSFIVLNSGHKYKDDKTDEISSRVPVVGSTITLRGYKSGKQSAKVKKTNFSYTGNDYTWENLIQCKYAMQAGDSGGGAIGGYTDGGRTALIVGINHAASSSRTLLIKGEVILDAYN